MLCLFFPNYKINDNVSTKKFYYLKNKEKYGIKTNVFHLTMRNRSQIN